MVIFVTEARILSMSSWFRISSKNLGEVGLVVSIVMRMEEPLLIIITLQIPIATAARVSSRHFHFLKRIDNFVLVPATMYNHLN